ncbi:polyprenyl synthetase family protein [bacterium]|nr:polyprenyl synthetase family protein [bacterium]NBX72319.1 polyprenyl synthetase family protein [bacterium]
MDALTDILSKLNNYVIEQLNSPLPLLNALVKHTFERPGKNIRARFMIQLAHFLKESATTIDFFKTATIIELIHCGTLVHDDVIDQNPLRRNGLATHEVFGNTCSILLGDYLFTKAYLIAQELNHKALFLPDLALAAHALVEGELLQLQQKNTVITFDEYLTIIQLKTASLFGFACKSVAQIYAPELQNEFHEIGFKFGTLFQLIDDFQDYFGTAEQLGKQPGQDFKEQKMTLPLLALKKIGLEKKLSSFFQEVLTFQEAVKILSPVRQIALDLIMHYAHDCKKAVVAIHAEIFLMPLINRSLDVLLESEYLPHS